MMTNINKHDCFQNHIIIIRPERRIFRKCGAQMGFLQLPAAPPCHGDPPAGGMPWHKHPHRPWHVAALRCLFHIFGEWPLDSTRLHGF